MANFYLELAAKILEIAQLPLTARDIVNRAQKAEMIPAAYRRAKTPHRTVQARLAESIRRDGQRSRFYRFAPGTFGLRSNLLDIGYSQLFGKEYKAPIRRKEISSEQVLCVPRASLRIDSQDGFFSIDAFYDFIAGNEALLYVPRRAAEKDFSLKQIVTYVAVVKGERVLCYERGAYSSAQDELIGRKSIGFGGHVSEEDLDLFSVDELGIVSNARRELGEELNLLSPHEVSDQLKIIGIINDNSTVEGNKHVAIAMIFICDDDTDPTKGELEISEFALEADRRATERSYVV